MVRFRRARVTFESILLPVLLAACGTPAGTGDGGADAAPADVPRVTDGNVADTPAPLDARGVDTGADAAADASSDPIALDARLDVPDTGPLDGGPSDTSGGDASGLDVA